MQGEQVCFPKYAFRETLRQLTGDGSGWLAEISSLGIRFLTIHSHQSLSV